ncbi:MAG TPA: lysophospholipid acyltransferase family protein [Humisphaera sp.]|nr:lysophospholipid acyltransferase family protein [Humisphaera sp.]
MTVLFDLKVYGAYNIPKTGGVLIVSNHQSYLDPILLSTCLDRTLSYLAKAELFTNRYFGWLIRNLNAFPVEQGAGDIAAVKESITRLQEGHVLNIFPEGSRTEDGEILPLEKGVALVIRRAKVPVVPVAIVGSWEAWPKGRKLPYFRPIRVLIGPPMNELWKLSRDEIIAELDKTLKAMYEEFRAGHLPPLPKRPRGR